MQIIGRQREINILRRCENSQKPEFVAVYGRRRVGKTYLITRHFDNKFTFSVTGISDGNLKVQLQQFVKSLVKYFQGDVDMPKNWYEAFDLLEKRIEQDPTLGKKVLFFDELPWLDTHKSGFVSALENFWNAFASRRSDILLIVCGSAASWMVNNLIESYGGLHNRVTEAMVVEPYQLHECEEFYRSRGIVFSKRQMAEAYMILGGIPFYMDAMDKMFGLNQNIDMLLFEKNAKLSGEFTRLYHSLFRRADNHIRIVEALSKNSSGLTRGEIISSSGISDGGGLTKALAELSSCGLIDKYSDYKKKQNGEYFRLVDFYSLFYYKYLKNKKSTDPNFWTNYLSTPAHASWGGYAFERLCMAHIKQIKSKLGILGVITNTYAFRSIKKGGAQIDLIIDRNDGVINLCECKFSNKEYALTEKGYAELERKRDVFIEETKTKKAIHLTMITAEGLSLTPYSNYIQAEITLDDLFAPV